MSELNKNLLLEIYDSERLAEASQIVLNGKNITKIEANAFKGLVKLKKLFLLDNKISLIELNAFRHLSNLRELYLNHNNLKEINSF